MIEKAKHPSASAARPRKHPVLRAGFPRLGLALGLGGALAVLPPGAGAALFGALEQAEKNTSECGQVREFVCATCGHFLEPELYDENERLREDACETGSKEKNTHGRDEDKGESGK